MAIRNLTNSDLLNSTKTFVAREKEMTLAVLRHLREIERRRLFAELAYSSLFDYVTRELGYDSASAMRRIDSMRLLKDLPEVEAKIEQGMLTLTAVARAQGFFRKEKLGIEKKQEIIAAIENKSTREVDKILAQASTNPALHFHEKIRPVTQELSEVRFYANDQLLKELEKIKGLLAHSHPIIRAVWKRDGGRCVWKNPKTGKVCGSEYRIQLDHEVPWALGGDNSTWNIRCLCFQHNQLEAEKWFGSR